MMRLRIKLDVLRGKGKFLLPALAPILLGSACAGLVHKEPAAPAATPPALPDVALTPDLLYDVLVGEIGAQRRRYDVAVDALVRAATRTRDPRLIERATWVAVYAKREAQARAAAELWAEVAPRSPVPHEILGGLRLRGGDARAAARHFARALELGEPGRGYERLLEVLGRAADPAAALAMMEHLVERHPDKPEGYYALAQLAKRLKRPQQAMQAVDRALALRPDWEDAAAFKAHLYLSAKKPEAVSRFCREYLKAYPEAKKVRLFYARFLLDNKRNDEARAQFKRITEYDPNDADAFYAVGLLAIEARAYREAERYLKRHLRLAPDNDQARLYLGQIAAQRRQYAKAVRWYGAVKDGKHRFEAQLRMAVAVGRQRGPEQALVVLHAAQPVTYKQHVQIILTEEQILREAKRFEAAMQTMNRALEKYPGDQDLLYARALLAAQMKLLDLHESDIRKLLAKDPKNAHALNALGYTLADQTDRYQEAFELITKALSLRPDDPYILDSMGWVQYRRGHHAEALEYLRRAHQKQNDAEIAAHLGEVLWVTGDREAARSVWERALELSPDNAVLLETLKRFGQ